MEGIVPTPIVLDPYAEDPMGASDRGAAARGGILAVDCSWNRLSDRGRFPGELSGERGRGVRRRLPMLVATNPQHYGRLAQLNTVEALAASLYLVGAVAQAKRLLEGFSGADEFLTVNRGRFEAYALAADSEHVRATERRLFGG